VGVRKRLRLSFSSKVTVISVATALNERPSRAAEAAGCRAVHTGDSTVAVPFLEAAVGGVGAAAERQRSNPADGEAVGVVSAESTLADIATVVASAAGVRGLRELAERSVLRGRFELGQASAAAAMSGARVPSSVSSEHVAEMAGAARTKAVVGATGAASGSVT